MIFGTTSVVTGRTEKTCNPFGKTCSSPTVLPVSFERLSTVSVRIVPLGQGELRGVDNQRIRSRG